MLTAFYLSIIRMAGGLRPAATYLEASVSYECTDRYITQGASSSIGAKHPIYYQSLFRVACKSLLMTGRPCLAEWVIE